LGSCAAFFIFERDLPTHATLFLAVQSALDLSDKQWAMNEACDLIRSREVLGFHFFHMKVIHISQEIQAQLTEIGNR
jgi:alpha/beta superfamily hydrolase